MTVLELFAHINQRISDSHLDPAHRLVLHIAPEFLIKPPFMLDLFTAPEVATEWVAYFGFSPSRDIRSQVEDLDVLQLIHMLCLTFAFELRVGDSYVMIGFFTDKLGE